MTAPARFGSMPEPRLGTPAREALQRAYNREMSALLEGRSRPAADWADLERDRMLTAQARADRQAMINRWHDARLRAAFNGDFRDEPVNRWRIDIVVMVIAAMIGAVLIGYYTSPVWAWLVL